MALSAVFVQTPCPLVNLIRSLLLDECTSHRTGTTSLDQHATHEASDIHTLVTADVNQDVHVCVRCPVQLWQVHIDHQEEQGSAHGQDSSRV